MNHDRVTVQSLLQELGYSAAEGEVMWALLNLENVSVRKVSDFSGINRGTAYEAIKKLAAAGLVSVQKRGEREYFSAESPEKLLDIIRDKRKDLLQTQEHAAKLIPELLARKARPQGQPLVRYYEGDEGVVTILKDVLQTCVKLDVPEYQVYSSKPLRQYIYRKFPQFTEKRIKESVEVRVIAIGEGGDPMPKSSRKWLEEPSGSEISSYVLIYGNKIATISLAENYLPYGVVVEDAGAAAMQRLLFNELWREL
jgi:sugar-specific transcriptional regulator TrmB